jgi:hypothetical protein
MWPERNFCSEDSFFKCNKFAHLETRRLGRMVKNDAEVGKLSVSTDFRLWKAQRLPWTLAHGRWWRG